MCLKENMLSNWNKQSQNMVKAYFIVLQLKKQFFF